MSTGAAITALAAEINFNDTFESSTIGESLSAAKYITGTDGVKGYISKTPKKDNEKSFVFDASESATGKVFWLQNKELFEGMNNDFTNAKFSVYFPEALSDGDEFYIQLFTNESTVVSGSSRNDTAMKFLSFRGNKIYNADGTEFVSNIPIGKWIDIRLTVYHSQAKYDAYVTVQEEELGSKTDANLLSSVTPYIKDWGIRRFRLCYSFGGGLKQVYIDNIVVNQNDDIDGQAQAFPADVTGNYNAVGLMQYLNIMSSDENNMFLPNKQVSRGEFAEMAVTAFKLGSSYSGESFFNDVAADNKYFSSISTLRDLNIISDAEMYRPDEPISLNEALVIVVNCLGYNELAEWSGGYPAGFLKVASDKNMLEDINTNVDFNREMCAVLLRNTLETGFAKIKYTVGSKELTPLAQYYNIYYDTGVLEICGSKVMYNQKTNDNQVRIGGYLYNNKYSRLEEYFGETVEFWYEENDGETSVVFAYPYKNKNSRLKIMQDDLIDITGNTIRFSDSDDKTKRANVAKDAVMLYNNRVVKYDAELLEQADCIELTCNDGGGTYNIVNVVCYTVINVGEVSYTYKKLYSNDGDTTLDFDTKERIEIYKDGKKTSLKSIRQNSVIKVFTEALGSYASVDSAEYLTIEIVTDTVTGTVTQTSNDAQIFIDGSEIPINSKYVVDYKIGDHGALYIDRDGIGVFFNKDAANRGGYGLITKVVPISEAGDEIDEIRIKIFTENDDFEWYTVSDSIKIDGKRAKKEAINPLLQKVINSEIVLYDTDMYGNLEEITTPSDKTNTVPYMPYDEGEYAKNYDGSSYVHSYGTSLTHSHAYGQRTAIFLMKPSPKNDDDYRIVPYNYFGTATGMQNSIKIYDTNTDCIAGAVLAVRNELYNTSIADMPRGLFIVSKVLEEVKNDDGETWYRIEGYSGGKPSVVYADETKTRILTTSKWSFNAVYAKNNRLTIDKLKKGDIIRVFINQKNNLAESIDVIYNSDIPVEDIPPMVYGPGVNNSNYYVGDFVIYAGAVEYNREKLIALNSVQKQCFSKNSGVVVYMYSGDRITTVAAGDIMPGDFVLMRTERRILKEIVVIKSK